MPASASFGAVAWVVLAFWAAPAGRWIEGLFALAPLVLVPLALTAIETAGRGRALRFLQPAAALAVAAAFVGPPGPRAAALTAPWLVVTLLLARRGLERFRSRGRLVAGEVVSTPASSSFPSAADGC